MVKARSLGPSLLLVMSALLVGTGGCAKQALQQPEAEKAALSRLSRDELRTLKALKEKMDEDSGKD